LWRCRFSRSHALRGNACQDALRPATKMRLNSKWVLLVDYCLIEGLITMNLSKQIIHKQVEHIVKENYIDEEMGKARSKAFVQLCVQTVLEMDRDSTLDCIVDGGGDFKIDAIQYSDPTTGDFTVSIFQGKYTANLEKDANFRETDVISIISSIRNLFGELAAYDIHHTLREKLNEINSYIEEGQIPTVRVYLCNNGLKWTEKAQSYIDDFANESPMFRELYEFIYINHDMLLSIQQKDTQVDCMLTFKGKFIDEELNFKRALIGTVPVENIADLMNKYENAILKQNVRDFLGFKRSVNDGIKTTLLDPEARKNFYFLNNGITMNFAVFGYAPSGNKEFTLIKMLDAQIINGGQTSKALQQVLSDPKNKQQDFSESMVLVRIYKLGAKKDEELIYDITLATNAITLRYLRANDSIQKKIEQGLRQYGIHYRRKRGYKRASKTDIRMEMAAEVILATKCHRPNEARFRKGLHFDKIYFQIFENKNFTIEELVFLVELFKKIESYRKNADVKLIKKYPFIPYASHHLLMLIYELQAGHNSLEEMLARLSEPVMQTDYHRALELLNKEIGLSVTTQIEMINHLKSERLNQRLLQAVKK